jgi:formamidopyrimidine-DNA glycosylase
MPELPEVETTVRYLKKKVKGRTFFDVWSDWKKTVKKPKSFNDFKKELKGKKILGVRRRAKNVLFDLSEGKTLLVHQKMTGHLLVGKWKKEDGAWQPPAGPLSDKNNSYIHLMFTFKDGSMMALSDLRKFAKVELWDSDKLKESEGMKELGPEPLEKDFTFAKFKKALGGQTRKIKQVLMDPSVIAGIGNIYSDEVLWEARVHPLRKVSELSEGELGRIYKAIRKILPLAVKLQGESFSDYRTPSGEKGGYDDERKVYQREGAKCSRCGGEIKRIKVGGRSAHFCSRCQKI